MDGAGEIGAYHALYEVERSFRMTKGTDARPDFHQTRDAIQAHLSIVFAALAVARYLQNETGVSIKRIVRALRPLRTVQIRVGGQTITAAPQIGLDARAILNKLAPITAPRRQDC